MRGATVVEHLFPLCHGVSIHAPRAGSDLRRRPCARANAQFQSTPPVRGATGIPGDVVDKWMFQSTPPVRGATLSPGYSSSSSTSFNPRPPCGERLNSLDRCGPSFLFQSTPPVRGATSTSSTPGALTCGFNPRPPCGERQPRLLLSDGRLEVSIHAPRAGSDSWYGLALIAITVSIHAPRAGSDKSNFYDMSY